MQLRAISTVTAAVLPSGPYIVYNGAARLNCIFHCKSFAYGVLLFSVLSHWSCSVQPVVKKESMVNLACLFSAPHLPSQASRQASSCLCACCCPCRLQQRFLPRFQIATAPVTLAARFSLCCLAAGHVTLASLAAAHATAPAALEARFSHASPASALLALLACPTASAHAAT
jgi:hypothetical protein